jgi:glutathione peroxidase
MGLVSTLKMYGRRKPARLDAASDLYRHQVTLLEGGTLDLETLRGHPTLIVSTASTCVGFPLTEKQSVRAQPSALWEDLDCQPGSGPPSWNFTKYLVGADGQLIDHWGPTTTPTSDKIRGAIEAALGD